MMFYDNSVMPRAHLGTNNIFSMSTCTMNSTNSWMKNKKKVKTR